MQKKSLIDSIIFESDYTPIIEPEDVKNGFSVEQLETLIRDRKDAIDYYRQNRSTASEDTLKNQAANYLGAKKGFNKVVDDFCKYKETLINYFFGILKELSYCITMVQTCKDYQEIFQKDYQEILVYITNIQCFFHHLVRSIFYFKRKMRLNSWI